MSLAFSRPVRFNELETKCRVTLLLHPLDVTPPQALRFRGLSHRFGRRLDWIDKWINNSSITLNKDAIRIDDPPLWGLAQAGVHPLELETPRLSSAGQHRIQTHTLQEEHSVDQTTASCKAGIRLNRLTRQRETRATSNLQEALPLLGVLQDVMDHLYKFAIHDFTLYVLTL